MHVPPRPSHPRKQGFTLTEVVISCVLIIVVMIPISRLSYQIIRTTEYTKEVGIVLADAQKRMEDMANGTYASIASGTATEDGRTYTWTVTNNGTTKTVEMDIVWTLRGTTLTNELNTVFASDADAGYTFDES